MHGSSQIPQATAGDDGNGSAVALVPARGGSKGLPGKNVRALSGKPLIAWTIEAARQAVSVGRVVVSTDDTAIAGTSLAHGAEVPFLRPADLAGDKTDMVDVALHFLDWLEADQGELPHWLVLLQPTSPLRLAADIDGALRQAAIQGADAVISVFPARPHPVWAKSLDDRGRLMAWLPETPAAACRQDLPLLYYPNGAIYGIRPAALRAHHTFSPPDCVAWIMPESRSLDIDTPWDFHLADLVMVKYEND